MLITHQEAHLLIQSRADQLLDSGKKELLNAHLRDCEACSEYANEIQETENTLRETLRKHWNMRPSPLRVMDIKARIIPDRRLSEFIAARSAMIGMVVLVFFFAFWQFNSTNTSFQNPVTIGVPAIPTPSLSLTSTQNNFDNCQMMRHEVQRDDTLESLARQFIVSEDVIRDLNNLQKDAETLPNLLIIPACELTPTSTLYPPTSTTNTPPLELITYTPG